MRYVKKGNFPPFLDQIIKMSPKKIPITAYARIMCQHCGLWNRGILCPPLLYQTYPQYKTIDSSREFIYSFKKAYVYVFKQDGRKRWWLKKDQKRFAHLILKKRKGRELKGAEAGGALSMTKLMVRAKNLNRKLGYTTEAFIAGHCDKCVGPGKGRKCPNRNNPPCRRGGLPSLEAVGINVHALLNQLEIEYQWPPINYITNVTMILIK